MKVVITGGASGLGAAITRKLIAEGHTVLFTYNNSAAEAEALVSAFPESRARRCDFSNGEDVGLFAEELKNFEPDALINNAISGKIPAVHFHKAPLSLFENGFARNVLPVIRITQAALDIFRKKKSGRIVTVLSSYVMDVPPTGLSAYVAEKNYLLSLSKSWAVENAKSGIFSNCVSPTFMLTPQNADVDERVIESMIASHPLKRLLTVEEVAVAIAELLNSGPEVNGTNKVINAGDYVV